MPPKNRSALSTALLILSLAAVATVLWAFRSGDDRLVVYCAHDAVFADEVLRDFQEQTGIPLTIRYDTEATKSLGLVNLLKEEQQRPQCDVFWNNELLGTVDLQQSEVLEPYRGTGFSRIPEQYKDPKGYWAGFGARMRVYVVNTDRMPASPEEIEQRLAQGDLSRATMAKPLFGTTLTHYTLLYHQWGPQRLAAWHRDTRKRGLREVNGNSATKDLVASGACDFGFTDTDDYFVAHDEGKPVAMVPARVEGKTICIPNSVAIIRGTKRQDAARKLVDYLLSAETELRLARSAARQVPLGPIDEAKLPEEVRPLAVWAQEGVDLRPLLADRTAVIAWLKSEYLQ